MDSSPDEPLGQLGQDPIARVGRRFRLDLAFAVGASVLFVAAAVTDEMTLVYCAIGLYALAGTLWWNRERAYERTLFFPDRAEMYTRQGPPRVILRNSISSVRFAQKQDDTDPYVEFVFDGKPAIRILGSDRHSGVANLPSYGKQRSATELARRIEIWRETAYYS